MRSALVFSYCIFSFSANFIPCTLGFSSSDPFHQTRVYSPTNNKHVLSSRTPSQDRDQVLSKQLLGRTVSTSIKSSSTDEDPMFNGQTTVALVGGQSLLVVGAVFAAQLLVSSRISTSKAIFNLGVKVRVFPK